jgi:Nucleotidyl transferase AbiEii toxin, Type IV TA system
LYATLAAELADATAGGGRIEVDPADADGQTLLVWYPAVESGDAKDLSRAVRIESGAKSALDPNKPVVIRPYIEEDLPKLDLSVPEVTTIEAERTFWDKVIIVHGLRRWFERRSELRHEGQQVSRHYYDLHCLMNSKTGKAALKDPVLAADCVRHARMFFDRSDYDLASARPGTFALTPVESMMQALNVDYDRTVVMIFGNPPKFETIMESIQSLEAEINRLQ